MAIAAVHAEAAAAAADWGRIVWLYDPLTQADPSPIVELNRAVAVAMREGPSAGPTLIDAILARGDLLPDSPGTRSVRTWKVREPQLNPNSDLGGAVERRVRG